MLGVTHITDKATEAIQSNLIVNEEAIQDDRR